MISKLSSVHPKAEIGTSVTIDPFAVVHEKVIIEDGCKIGSNAVILPNTHLKANCVVFPGAVIGAIPQDLKFAGEDSWVEIGEGTTIREFVTIHRGTRARMITRIGKYCLLMAYTHVGHDSSLGDHCILANSVAIAGHVDIGDYVVLEGLVAVQQFVKIGSHSFIAGASLVRKDVPPYVKAARRAPISFVGVNVIGLERRGYSRADIQSIEDIYKLLFIHSQNVSIGLSKVRELEGKNKFVGEILRFIGASDKGIIKGMNPDGN